MRALAVSISSKVGSCSESRRSSAVLVAEENRVSWRDVKATSRLEAVSKSCTACLLSDSGRTQADFPGYRSDVEGGTTGQRSWAVSTLQSSRSPGSLSQPGVLERFWAKGSFAIPSAICRPWQAAEMASSAVGKASPMGQVS